MHNSRLAGGHSSQSIEVWSREVLKPSTVHVSDTSFLSEFSGQA
jgi:hypothetical protein